MPPMGSFKRSLFGYRRDDVDAAISARDAQIDVLERRPRCERADDRRARTRAGALSGMVIEREREIRILNGRLREANERHDRSIASLDAVSARLEEMQAQARGQATRIRMKALREAVEVSRRVQALTEAEELGSAEPPATRDGHATNGTGDRLRRPLRGPDQARDRPAGGFLPAGRLRGCGRADRRLRDLGRTLLRGPRDPLDAPGQPVELLRELEELSRSTSRSATPPPDNLILDLDEDRAPSSAPPSPARALGPFLNLPGAVAQLEERRAGSAKVRGSSPLSSTLNETRLAADVLAMSAVNPARVLAWDRGHARDPCLLGVSIPGKSCGAGWRSAWRSRWRC